MFSRRQLLQRSAIGFGSLALDSLLAEHSPAATRMSSPHHAPKAKRVIFLFMKGGPSQMDTFDYKPQLQKNDHKPLPFEKPRVQFAPTGDLLASPWKFKQYGESGIAVSELFPNVARCVDDLCIINSMHGSNPAHGGACLKIHTGSDTFVRPSMGSWITYGLGTENENLPGFITICPTLAHGGTKNWSSAFLPASHSGTPLGNASQSSDQARVKFIQNSNMSGDLQRMQLDMTQSLNANFRETTGPNAQLDARIKSFELAFRMQTEMPTALDLADETQATHSLYGIDDPGTADFGRQCLMARRFAERGVRFVQVTHSNTEVQWDQHGNLRKGHLQNAKEVDKPIAGLLRDLKARGLLKDTLVLWGGEFGRTPTCQGKGHDGRDHNPEGFTMWLAGGGVRSGIRYGATDEFGYYATENRVHIHDLHATILHLLGLDHLQLTHRHAGRNFRLTDVAGRVVDDIIA
ncbi:DUF1501 domain-containing protein [Rubripirellula reticaptiva]|uniref:Sulfatase n=1 Tax=Rubripirellula reticaptiva TaxID=2528013 RepID=A0A5C6F4I0_9BACT|nr:DUF1501 domain-containing protein [Rubripirellula reticaptiva]TWU55357.1 hypothetical protein Poly59_16550 [Rubripirellula reticaptiva]